MDDRWSRRIFFVVCATLISAVLANVAIWWLATSVDGARVAAIEARVTELERTAITR